MQAMGFVSWVPVVEIARQVNCGIVGRIVGNLFDDHLVKGPFFPTRQCYFNNGLASLVVELSAGNKRSSGITFYISPAALGEFVFEVFIFLYQLNEVGVSILLGEFKSGITWIPVVETGGQIQPRLRQGQGVFHLYLDADFTES